ncbi:MAG: hypothetical protein ACRC6M_18240 [Microcystaceae cyanobacterium]
MCRKSIYKCCWELGLTLLTVLNLTPAAVAQTNAQTMLTVVVVPSQSLMWTGASTPQQMAANSKGDVKLTFGQVTATTNTTWEIKAASSNQGKLKSGNNEIPYTFEIQGGVPSQSLVLTEKKVYDGGSDVSKGIAQKVVYLHIAQKDTVNQNPGNYTDTVTLTVVPKD